jgi:hypothetical protein
MKFREYLSELEEGYNPKTSKKSKIKKMKKKKTRGRSFGGDTGIDADYNPRKKPAAGERMEP